MALDETTTDTSEAVEGKGKTEDNREESGQGGGLKVCYLVNASARITSEYFDVYIPTMMSGTEPAESDKPKEEKLDKKLNLSEDANEFSDTVKTSGSIKARNCTNYFHRIDGWIPHFKIDHVHVTSGDMATLTTSTTSHATEQAQCKVGAPHSHGISAGQSSTGIQMTDMNYRQLDVWGSHQVDLQECNRKYIKKGQKMYGMFAEGLQSEFCIMAIDKATPYLTEAEDNNTDDDNPDTTSFDKGKTNFPNTSDPG